MALPSKADHPLNHFKILQGSFTQIYCRSILFLKKGSFWNGMLSIFNVSFDSICIDFLTLTYNVILWHCREKLHCCFHIFAPKKGIFSKVAPQTVPQVEKEDYYDCKPLIISEYPCYTFLDEGLTSHFSLAVSFGPWGPNWFSQIFPSPG